MTISQEEEEFKEHCDALREVERSQEMLVKLELEAQMDQEAQESWTEPQVEIVVPTKMPARRVVASK